MKLFKQITVDLYNPFPLKKLVTQQNNIGRGVIVTLTAGSEIVDPSEEDVKLWAKRPDGNVSYLPCTVQSDGTIKAPFSSQMLSMTGNIIVSLELISGEDDITTPIFIIENNVNISDHNAAESTNEFTALQQAVSQMNTAMQEVEELKKEGLKGDPGIAATVRVGNVSASEPGGNPEITNSGTENDAILDFVLPRGIQGPKGEAPDTVDPMLATEIGFPADAKLTGAAIGELNKNTTSIETKLSNYNNALLLADGILYDIESSFIKSSNFSIFQGSSTSDIECGWYGFRHTNSKVCYITLYSGSVGILCGKRDKNGSWSFKKIID